MKKIILLLLFAQVIYSQNKPDASLIKIESYKKKDTIKVEMIVDYCVANTFSNSTKVLEMANQGLKISKEINYKVGQIRSLNCIGNYYYQQAIYDKATQFYLLALVIAEKNNDVKNIVIGKNNMGNIFTRTKKTEKALQLLKEADSILVANGQENSQNRAAILTNIGGLYSSMQKHEEAINYHKKTLALCEKEKIPFGIAIAAVNIGEEFVLLKKYNTAALFLQKSQTISEKEGYDNFLGQIYKNLAIVSWNENQKLKSFDFLEKAITICEKINEQNELIKTLEIKQKFHLQNNDFKNAFLTAAKLKVVNQNVNGIEKDKAINEINAKYETEKKENQINVLKKDKQIADLKAKKQQALVIVLLMFLLSILIVGYLAFKRYKLKKQTELLKNKLIEAEKTIIAEKKASESELKAIKAQMNPHFFFNALNTIQSYITTNETEEASNYLNKFSKLTRMILEMTDKNWITIEEELRMQTLYLDLQKVRLSDFDFQIELNQINLQQITIPTMLLQPYVENAIIHGLAHKLGPKKLLLDFNIENNRLKINIKDNGIGIEKATKINQKNTSKNTSFATKATLERLEIINRNECEISVETNEIFDSNKQSLGTEVNITMEIRYEL